MSERMKECAQPCTAGRTGTSANALGTVAETSGEALGTVAGGAQPEAERTELGTVEKNVTKVRLAMEFNRRYGTNLNQRMAKLLEEVTEAGEALMRLHGLSDDRTYNEWIETYDDFLSELRDAASVMNQLEHWLLPKDWPQQVHDLLKKRDADPEYGRKHKHERNAEAGE